MSVDKGLYDQMLVLDKFERMMNNRVKEREFRLRDREYSESLQKE